MGVFGGGSERVFVGVFVWVCLWVGAWACARKTRYVFVRECECALVCLSDSGMFCIVIFVFKDVYECIA